MWHYKTRFHQFLKRFSISRVISFIYKIKYVLIIITTGVAFIFYFYQGIPGKGRWNPGMRFDISGVSLIPETDILLTVSDRGPLAGFFSFFSPTMLVVNTNSFLPATRVSIDIKINKKIENIHWKWDAEAIKCITLHEQKVGCALISGSRKQLIWVRQRLQKMQFQEDSL